MNRFPALDSFPYSGGTTYNVIDVCLLLMEATLSSQSLDWMALYPPRRCHLTPGWTHYCPIVATWHSLVSYYQRMPSTAWHMKQPLIINLCISPCWCIPWRFHWVASGSSCLLLHVGESKVSDWSEGKPLATSGEGANPFGEGDSLIQSGPDSVCLYLHVDESKVCHWF